MWRLDLHLRAELRELDRHHGVTDVLLQPRRVAGRSDVADLRALGEYRKEVDHRSVVIGTEVLAAYLHAHEFAPDPQLLDAPQCGFSDEVGVTIEVDHPCVADADLERIRIDPHVRSERKRR